DAVDQVAGQAQYTRLEEKTDEVVMGVEGNPRVLIDYWIQYFRHPCSMTGGRFVHPQGDEHSPVDDTPLQGILWDSGLKDLTQRGFRRQGRESVFDETPDGKPAHDENASDNHGSPY